MTYLSVPAARWWVLKRSWYPSSNPRAFVLFTTTVFAVVAAIALGGSTRAGYLSDVVLQCVAAALLLLALNRRWRGSTNDISLHARLEYALLAIAPLALLLYVLPLPGSLLDVLQANLGLGTDTGPMQQAVPATLSLAPQATWAALTSLIVPLAIFVAVVELDRSQQLKICWLIVALGAFSICLGLLQVATGPESSLRFFDVTNTSEAVGFFANRNHFAAQIYVTLVFGFAWFWGTSHLTLRSDAGSTRAVLWLSLAVALLIAVMSGLAMARSRAGLLLAIPAIVGIFAIILFDQRSGQNDRQGIPFRLQPMALIVLAFAVLFAAQFGLHRFIVRFEQDPLEDLRLPLSITTLEAATGALPFGTGPGTFVPVYATAEKTNDLFSGFANRAHNDYAELMLETGVLGAVLLLAFLVWYVLRCRSIWFAASHADAVLTMQRAATIVILLLLAHSFVDYPLRTSALAALFACSAAVMARDQDQRLLRQLTEQHNAEQVDGSQLLTPEMALTASSESQVPATAMAPKPPAALRARWGKDIEWPEAWKEKKNEDGN